jgi:hypothetical protein
MSQDSDAGGGDDALWNLPPSLSKPDFTRDELAAAHLISRMRFFPLVFKYPKTWLTFCDPQIGPEETTQQKAERTAEEFVGVLRQIAECIEEAGHLPSGITKRRTLTLLFYAKQVLDPSGDSDDSLHWLLKKGSYDDVIESCYLCVKRCDKSCSRKMRWMVAELSGWLSSRGKQPPQPAIRDRALDERDKWIYEECCNGTAYDSIIRKLKQQADDWPRIESPQGIRMAAIRFAERQQLPPIPRRQDL